MHTCDIMSFSYQYLFNYSLTFEPCTLVSSSFALTLEMILMIEMSNVVINNSLRFNFTEELHNLSLWNILNTYFHQD